MSKVIGNVFFDNFCWKKFPLKNTQNGDEGQKMKILLCEPNSTKFCLRNLWATRRLEMQKLGAEGECGDGAQGPGVGGEVEWGW